MILRLMDAYYRITNGYCNEVLDKITETTLMYLIDNKYEFKDILNILRDSKIEDCFRPESLPDYLWDNSLLKRDTYYYHNSLHITSKPPRWNAETLKVESEPFFMEMKIKFTMKDLLDYYYRTCMVDVSLRNEKRDIGAFEHLIKTYTKIIENVEGIDIVLMLIDEASKASMLLSNPLKLQDMEIEVIPHCKRLTVEAKYNDANKIIWRSSNV